MNEIRRSQKAIQAFEAYQEKKRAQIQNNEKLKHMEARKCIRPLLRLLLFGQRKLCGFQVEMLNKVTFEIKRPVIFAVTHIGKWEAGFLIQMVQFG